MENLLLIALGRHPSAGNGAVEHGRKWRHFKRRRCGDSEQDGLMPRIICGRRLNRTPAAPLFRYFTTQSGTRRRGTRKMQSHRTTGRVRSRSRPAMTKCKPPVAPDGYPSTPRGGDLCLLPLQPYADTGSIARHIPLQIKQLETKERRGPLVAVSEGQAV